MGDLTYPEDPAKFVVRRLRAASDISESAAHALRRAISTRPLLVGHVEVEVDSCAAFLLEGLACRARLLPDGRRHLTGFLVSGDLCDHGFLSGCKTSTRILTLSRCVAAEVRMPIFLDLCDEHPDLLRALLKVTAIEAAMAEEHIVSLGVRTAAERLGHLLCEMHERLDTVGLAEQGSFTFRVTQAELGEGLGMSAVHVNRTLQLLRREKLVSSRDGRVDILDAKGLREMAGYDPSYLY